MDTLMQLRLFIGDAIEPYVLTDEQLQFYLDEANGNIVVAANKLRPIVAMQLATSQVREREGSVEVYGGEKSSNFLRVLKFLEEQGSLDFKASAAPIIGGVRKSANIAIDNDPESVGCGVKLGDSFL